MTKHILRYGPALTIILIIILCLPLIGAGNYNPGTARLVKGPASSTDNAIVRFDGTDGKKTQDSTATVDDNGLVQAAGAVDGRFTGFLVENTQADAGGSLNETAEILFRFAGKTVARITADKLSDYTSGANEDSRLGFWVDVDGTLTQVAHIMPEGLMLMVGNSRIRFSGTAGGGGQAIQYKDSGGSMRNALMFPGSDIVELGNKAADGVVEIHANTSTAGSGGDVTVAEFQDDQISFLVSGGSLGVGGTPNVNRQFDLVGVFNGNTRLSITDILAASAEAQQAFIGGTINGAATFDAHGLRIAPILVKAGTDTHNNFNSLTIAPPTITAGAATLTNASTLKIQGPPTGAANNFAFWVDDGTVRFDGGLEFNGTAGNAEDVIVSNGAGAAPTFDSRDGARVFNNANISIPNSSDTALTFNSERWDDNTIHDTSTNPGRLTATIEGRYQICGGVTWAANATGNRNLSIRLNGSTTIALEAEKSLSAGKSHYTICTTTQLAAAGYAELMAFQDSGGALNVELAANRSPEFMMQRLRTQ